ncbi:hypothetical protein Emed_001107 [Eimeria media]
MSAADLNQLPDRAQSERRWTLPHRVSETSGHGALKARGVTNQQLLQEIKTCGFCAWPIHGVLRPGEKTTVQFGFWCTEGSGVHSSEWELCVYPGSRAAILGISLPLTEPASTSIITVVAVMPTVHSPAEVLWRQQSKTRRKVASRAAHETIQQLMQLIDVCSPEAKRVCADVKDPQVRESLFVKKNESLGLAAPSPLVDEFLLLRQQAERLQPSKQCYPLVILHREFQPLQVDLHRRAELPINDNANVQRVSPCAAPYDVRFASARNTLSSETQSDEGGGPSLEVALAAAAADMNAFSVQALHRHLLVIPRQLQRREYLRAMQRLIFQCDDWQPHSFLQEQARPSAQGPLQAQNVAADSILHSALSEAIEAFLLVLPEALDLFGLSTSEDEKGRQATRGSKRQYSKNKRESKVCEDPGGSALAGAASAALAAAMASLSEANNNTGGGGDAQTRHCVAEQLLYWLLKEIVGAKEPDLAMSAATKTAAFGSAVAQAAREQQRQHKDSLFSHLLRETLVPSPLDLRKLEYRVHLAGEMALALLGSEAGEDVIALLQQATQREDQEVLMQQRLQQRLEFLQHLLPRARKGVVLCLGLSSEQARGLQLQDTTPLSQLFQEMLGSETQQEQMLPVACLHTAEEIAFFIEDTAQKKGLVPLQPDASPVGTASKDSADFEFSPCLFIVPSWQIFSTLATQTLTTLLQELPLAKASTAVRKIRCVAENVDLGSEANYLTVRRHMMELAALLDIDLLLLDSFDSVTEKALGGAPPIVEDDLGAGLAAAATAGAAVEASNPWLLGLPATRVLGPHVTSYLLATCLLMGIDAATLQERATQLRLDWKEETRKKESLDAAADAVCRRIRKESGQLLIDRRSCCLYQVPAETVVTTETASLDDDGALSKNSDHLLTGVAKQMHDNRVAIMCSYWDLAFSEASASATAAPAEPILQWAALQLQHLRAVISGTVISDVLLAGDLISLICGFALNGHVVLESLSKQDDYPRHHEVLDDPNSAAKANARAAGAAIDATEAAAAGRRKGILRAWLEIPRDPSEDMCCSSTGTTICNIQPRVSGVRQLREFLQQQLLAVLDLAEERNVVIRFPSEVLLHVEPPTVAESANESPAANELNCLRRNSEGCASSQRSGSKTGKGSMKAAAADGSADVAVISEGAVVRTAEEKTEKEQPMLVICHLPQARLLWNVLRDTQTSACVPVTSQVEKSTHGRRSSRDGNAAHRPYGTYASLPITAIQDIVASVGTSKLFLWLGEDLSRQTHTIQKAIKAAGFLDATGVFTQSLLRYMK